ncbi:hypothetical protein ZWY2020_051221 [Hordeum vulgare]|nr:hypothetical protein ZWY2020_051221 [Hordeum vulgare]
MATISAALSVSILPSLARRAVSTASSSPPRFKRAARFRCCAEPPSPEQQETSAPPPPPPAPPSSLWGVSTSVWTAGVAGLGLLETGYLSYLKLTGSEAFCPVAGGGCGDVLDSDYSVVFGIPLPLVGMVTYGMLFGREAMEILDYVECFPNGAGKGKKMAEECVATGLEGFPTWVINGKLLSGDQELSVLAEESGFVSESPEQS